MLEKKKNLRFVGSRVENKSRERTNDPDRAREPRSREVREIERIG